ncbi:probable ubiquitin carboxyl-terminal hydrolase 9 [Nasonia vitripennis]|uniref:ubiquitinyl hydrolase 1 n=1 Tax=Nasonia vitripennis TaxID=7425 RepID=A0A7M7QBK5_NASVI|nr:probable ubiquitin carboxyl-terminal hydrolase 9 [Nasonia vitripennis]
MKLEGPHMYELFSIIVHSGTPINGHYYACIRDFRSGNWLSFNDHIVTPITHDKITETYGNGISTANAYVVTYRQIDRERNALPIESSQFPPHIKELLSEENTKAEQPVKFDPENHSSIAGSFWGSTCKTHDNLSLQYPLNDIEHECISDNYVDLLPPSIAMKLYSENDCSTDEMQSHEKVEKWLIMSDFVHTITYSCTIAKEQLSKYKFLVNCYPSIQHYSNNIKKVRVTQTTGF